MSERDHERLAAKIAIPNKEALEPVYVEIMELLDTDENYTLDVKELQKMFTKAEAKAILDQFDLDKTGDISVWELRQYYGDESKAQDALAKLKGETKKREPKTKGDDRVV